MGTLIYGDAGVSVRIADTLLAHVQIVVGRKLQLHQGFFLAWKDGLSVGGGRSSVWMTPSVVLVFSYERARGIRIDPAQIQAMLAAADSPLGLNIDRYIFGETDVPRSSVRSAPTKGLRVA